MADDSEKVVKVLYDYTYSDEGENIEIKKGDIYRLIEKTNSEWWQVYDPSDYNGESFFVPAQYVEVVSEDSALKALSDLDKVLTFGDCNDTSDLSEEEDNKDKAKLSETSKSKQNLIYNNVNSKCATQVNKATNDVDEGEYVNLDIYREVAGIPSEGKTSVSSADISAKPLISQDLIQGITPPPLPSEGIYVKELLKGLPWDIYKEHTLGRNFYVNRETGERAWKPPRKEKSSPDQKAPDLSSLVSDSSPADKDGEWSGIPPEYEQVHDNGNVYFIHKSTQEKWKRIVDKVGRKYFHKVGSSDTLWALPGASGVPGKEAANENNEQTIQIKPSLRRDVHWDSPGQRMSTFGGQSLRATKAMSTYGQLETSAGAINRSSTLPANFLAAKVQLPVNERSSSPTAPKRPTILTSPSLNNLTSHEDVLEGYVNKAKLPELGSKKKVKKNWSQVYLLLQGSNLIFYKDQKAAAQKVNSPHGKPEMVVTLQGAHVDFNPPKEYSSKKNTILLQSKSGAFLFHHENEKTIREWFTRMKIVANDVSPITESSPREFDSKDDKKTAGGVMRSVSIDETTSITNVDKNKNMVGIRAKLLGLISRRPTQEDLYKRGIIKDAVFGSLLHELCDKEKNNVPKFVHLCIQAVENKGLIHDGLYRISGNMAEIQRLRYTVEREENYNLYEEQWDVHVLTGTLKLFFRELKEPVFPYNLYDRFIEAIKKETKKERLGLFKSAVGDLPRCNYHTLKELFQHLCKVVEVWRENRMQTQNIAIVFGPTLMWQKEEGGSLAVQTVYQSKIVEFFLLEYNELFK